MRLFLREPAPVGIEQKVVLQHPPASVRLGLHEVGKGNDTYEVELTTNDAFWGYVVVGSAISNKEKAEEYMAEVQQRIERGDYIIMTGDHSVRLEENVEAIYKQMDPLERSTKFHEAAERIFEEYRPALERDHHGQVAIMALEGWPGSNPQPRFVFAASRDEAYEVAQQQFPQLRTYVVGLGVNIAERLVTPFRR